MIGTSTPGAALAWTLLVVAGLFEVSWAVGLRYTEGFTRLVPSVVTAVSMLASVGLLGFCVRTLPLGTAYAVWTGIGVIGTVVFGIVVLHEPATVGRMACVAMIFCGIVGLRILYQP
jgi:quaternary ammonium compound-resistance protein SugE